MLAFLAVFGGYDGYLAKQCEKFASPSRGGFPWNIVTRIGGGGLPVILDLWNTFFPQQQQQQPGNYYG